MPEDIDEVLQKEAEALFKKNCNFVLGVQQLTQLPEPILPEIAFAGRSNVGKSSLLNAVLNRRDLARTSNTPGRTQQLNFFNLADHLHLVDLPGYGYAKVSKKERNDWQRTLKDYLKGRVNLRRAYILVDGRHGMKDTDGEMMTMLDDAAVSYTVVLTKIDKVKREELEKTEEAIKLKIKKHAAAFPELIKTSSIKKFGLDDLRTSIYLDSTIL